MRITCVTQILYNAKAITLNTPEQLQPSLGPHTQALGLRPQLYDPSGLTQALPCLASVDLHTWCLRVFAAAVFAHAPARVLAAIDELHEAAPLCRPLTAPGHVSVHAPALAPLTVHVA